MLAAGLRQAASQPPVATCWCASTTTPRPVRFPTAATATASSSATSAGEILDRYPSLQLVDYGFAYRRDPNFPQDDITWFLMEKRELSMLKYCTPLRDAGHQARPAPRRGRRLQRLPQPTSSAPRSTGTQRRRNCCRCSKAIAAAAATGTASCRSAAARTAPTRWCACCSWA